MNKDLTFLLLLKDRAEFTWRWMRYYNESKIPFKIVIADGGKDESVKKLSDKSLFPNLDYEYIAHPYDKDLDTFFRKIRDAVFSVKTKYTIIMDNDDFYFPASINKSIEFLESNPDYVSARGDVYDFIVSSGINGKMGEVKPLYTNPSNDSPIAIDRIKFFSEYLNSSWHDVNRTENLKSIFETLCHTGMADIQSIEYLFNFLHVSSGKVHRDRGLHMLHQSHEGSLGHTISKRDPFDWILSDPWPKDFFKMIDIASEKVASKDNTSKEKAQEKICQYYIANTLGKRIIKEKVERDVTSNILKSKIMSLGNLLPKKSRLRSVMKNWHFKTKNYFQEKRNRKYIATSPYLADIDKIRDFLGEYKPK